MDNLGLKSIIASIILFVLLAGFFVLSNLAKTPQTIRSRASENTSLAINMISPRPNSKMFGVSKVSGSVVFKGDIKSLNGVLKIGENSQPLTIERINPDTILLSTSLDTTRFSPAAYNLELFLYQVSSEKPSLAASTQVPITIVAP